MARLEIERESFPKPLYALSDTTGAVLRIVFAGDADGKQRFPDAEIEIDDASGVVTLRSCGSCMMPVKPDAYLPAELPSDILAVFPSEIRLAIR